MKKLFYFDLQNLETGNDDQILVSGDERLGTRKFWGEVIDRALKATDPDELEEGDGLTPETVIEALRATEGVEFVEYECFGIELPNSFEEAKKLFETPGRTCLE
jgi:hypothetical protein